MRYFLIKIASDIIKVAAVMVEERHFELLEESVWLKWYKILHFDAKVYQIIEWNRNNLSQTWNK